MLSGVFSVLADSPACCWHRRGACAGGHRAAGVFWLGATVLSLAFAATERSYAVLGRNRC